MCVCLCICIGRERESVIKEAIFVNNVYACVQTYMREKQMISKYYFSYALFTYL